MPNNSDDTLNENVPGREATAQAAAPHPGQVLAAPLETSEFAQPAPSDGFRQPPQSPTDPKPAPKPTAWERFCDWFYMRKELGQAREREARSSGARRTAIERACAHAQVADWALEAGAGSPYAAALSLYREATFWLLSEYGSGERSLFALINAAPQATLEKAAGGKAQLARLRDVLAKRDFLASAEMAVEEQLLTAELARSFVRALIDQASALTVRFMLARRRVRIAATSVVLTAAFIAMMALGSAITSPTDLARNLPWTVSSQENIVLPLNIRFHTKQEMNPWFEIDLANPRRVQGLYVRNRTDCCLERAIPLVAETSVDHTTWTEVARQEAIFTEWTPSFPSVTARYVRLRVPRVAVLHLEQVKVF
jgi:hypothetical protein